MDTRYTVRALRERPDAILFDWDNTLMDHHTHTLPVVEALARELGRPPYPSAEEINTAWAEDAQACSDRYFGGRPPQEVTEIFHKMVDSMSIDDVTLMPGAQKLLDTLRDKGMRMAIVSNKPEEHLKREVAALGLTDYFDVLRGDRGNGPLKPDPAPLMETLRDMKLPLGNLWYVGDMVDDVGAARSDGFQRFLVGHRHRKKSQALSHGADPAGRIIYLDSIALMQDFAEALPDAKERIR